MMNGMYEYEAEPTAEFDVALREARRHGGLYHPTNPVEAWFCRHCQVFGRGGPGCWCCGRTVVDHQWIPAFGGGAESVVWERPAA